MGAVTTLLALIFLPTFVKAFTKIMNKMGDFKSVPALGVYVLRNASSINVTPRFIKPHYETLQYFKQTDDLPKKVLILNTLAISISSVGYLAALYAAYLYPEYRITCMTLSPVINGLATIILFILVDPRIAMITDSVLNERQTLLYYKKIISYLLLSTFLGFIIGQVILIPAAHLVGTIASVI